MKTVADFKRKMQVGASVNTTLYKKNHNTNELTVQREYETRTVSIVMSARFAFKTWIPEKEQFTNSYCDFPKAKDFTPIDENTAEIHFPNGKLVYKFV